MASFVKLFKRKTSKQISLSDPFNSAQFTSNSTANMHGRKQFRASFRINRNAQQCDCGRKTNECCNNAIEYGDYKSPYSVFTEPKMVRSTQSCPVGPPNEKEKRHRMRNCRKFSPPFDVQTTIHERSGSYENVTASQMEQSGHGKGRESAEGSEGRERETGGVQAEKPRQRRQQQKQQQDTREGVRTGGRYKCHGVHSVAHCSHHRPPLQPLSTSEYWSADPSPTDENQSRLRHFRICQGPTNGIRGQMTMAALFGLEVGEDEESSSEDGDNSSDDQEISPTALLQFWQQQARTLKRELNASRETAEKYRSKYLRLKTKTDELSNELTREKERNIWLFSQLIALNERTTQLNWTHQQMHGSGSRDGHSQHNLLTMKTAEIVGNDMRFPNNCLFEPLMKDERIENHGKCNAQHRSTAGEVQAELSSDDFDEKTAAVIRQRICNVATDCEEGKRTMGQPNKRQPQLMRTPTPVPMDTAANDCTNGLLMDNFLGVPGETEFPNFNANGHHIQSQLHVEVARGSHLNSSRNSNYRLISPPIKRGVKKADFNDNSPMTIEEDENVGKFQVEEASESLIGADPEEQWPIVIPLDAFCRQNYQDPLKRQTTLSAKLLLRHCHSSEDIRSPEKRMAMAGSAMGSSSEDDVRMWKKQLRSRGERVLFRPSRKNLFSGVIRDERGPNKIFRRFAQPEREALAKFDYLCDERTDISGLMSSPEKMADSKVDD